MSAWSILTIQLYYHRHQQMRFCPTPAISKIIADDKGKITAVAYAEKDLRRGNTMPLEDIHRQATIIVNLLDLLFSFLHCCLVVNVAYTATGDGNPYHSGGNSGCP